MRTLLKLALLALLVVAVAAAWSAAADEARERGGGCAYDSGECGPSGPQPAPGQ